MFSTLSHPEPRRRAASAWCLVLGTGTTSLSGVAWIESSGGTGAISFSDRRNAGHSLCVGCEEGGHGLIVDGVGLRAISSDDVGLALFSVFLTLLVDSALS